MKLLLLLLLYFICISFSVNDTIGVAPNADESSDVIKNVKKEVLSLKSESRLRKVRTSTSSSTSLFSSSSSSSEIDDFVDYEIRDVTRLRSLSTLDEKEEALLEFWKPLPVSSGDIPQARVRSAVSYCEELDILLGFGGVTTTQVKGDLFYFRFDESRWEEVERPEGDIVLEVDWPRERTGLTLTNVVPPRDGFACRFFLYGGATDSNSIRLSGVDNAWDINVDDTFGFSVNRIYTTGSFSEDDSGEQLEPVERYKPKSVSWSGDVFVFGGRSRFRDPLGDMWRFSYADSFSPPLESTPYPTASPGNPTIEQGSQAYGDWTRLDLDQGDIKPRARFSFSESLQKGSSSPVGDRWIIFAGAVESEDGSTVEVASDVWSYDFATNTWEELVPTDFFNGVKYGRTQHVSGILGSQLIVLGGYEGQAPVSETQAAERMITAILDPSPSQYLCFPNEGSTARNNWCQVEWPSSATTISTSTVDVDELDSAIRIDLIDMATSVRGNSIIAFGGVSPKGNEFSGVLMSFDMSLVSDSPWLEAAEGIRSVSDQTLILNATTYTVIALCLIIICILSCIFFRSYSFEEDWEEPQAGSALRGGAPVSAIAALPLILFDLEGNHRLHKPQEKPNPALDQEGNAENAFMIPPLSPLQRQASMASLGSVVVSTNNGSVLSNENECCAICLMDFERKEILRQLPCEHFFHPECIQPWLIKNSACPLCKRDILNPEENTAEQEQEQEQGQDGESQPTPSQQLGRSPYPFPSRQNSNGSFMSGRSGRSNGRRRLRRRRRTRNPNPSCCQMLLYWLCCIPSANAATTTPRTNQRNHNSIRFGSLASSSSAGGGGGGGGGGDGIRRAGTNISFASASNFSISSFATNSSPLPPRPSPRRPGQRSSVDSQNSVIHTPQQEGAETPHVVSENPRYSI